MFREKGVIVSKPPILRRPAGTPEPRPPAKPSGGASEGSQGYDGPGDRYDGPGGGYDKGAGKGGYDKSKDGYDKSGGYDKGRQYDGPSGDKR